MSAVFFFRTIVSFPNDENFMRGRKVWYFFPLIVFPMKTVAFILDHTVLVEFFHGHPLKEQIFHR